MNRRGTFLSKEDSIKQEIKNLACLIKDFNNEASYESTFTKQGFKVSNLSSRSVNAKTHTITFVYLDLEKEDIKYQVEAQGRINCDSPELDFITTTLMRNKEL